LASNESRIFSTDLWFAACGKN